MKLRCSTILLLGTMCAAVGCGARPVPPATPVMAATSAAAPATPVVAPATSAVPAATWLELEGARMLVTTTRAARGRVDAGLPILIVLSWSRSTPAEVLAEVGYVDIDVPARIVAIEGFERDGEGFSWWRRTRPAPDDPDRDHELVQRLTERAARLAVLVGAVHRHFGSARRPVVSGVSQGGDLSVALGVLHPTAIAAALPIAARFPAPMWPPPTEAGGALPPVDAFHGTADRMAPLAPLQRAMAALRDRGYPVVLHAYDGVSHEVSAAERADVHRCAALRLRGSGGSC